MPSDAIPSPAPDASPTLRGVVNTEDQTFAGNKSFMGDIDVGRFTAEAVAVGGSEDPSAIMQGASTTQGFLPPRMTAVQRDAIASAAVGLVIFNTDSQRQEFFDGARWISRSKLELSSYGPTDARDRTAHINAALAGSGHIYLGPGQYMVSAPLVVASKTHLEMHPLAVLKRDPAMPQGTQMIMLTGVSSVLIEGGVLDGNKANGFGGFGQCAGLATLGVTDVVIRNMEIKDWPAESVSSLSYGYGLYLGGLGTTPNKNVYVQNVVIHGCEQDQFHMASGIGVTVEDCHAYDGNYLSSGFDVEPGGIYERVQSLTIRNCIFEGSGIGLTFNNHFSGFWRDITVEGCRFHSNRTYGLFTSGGNNGVGLRIHGCSAYNNYVNTGISVSQWLDAVISNCDSRGNGGGGIAVIEGSNTVVKDCNAIGNGSHGIGISGSVLVDFKALISGCGVFNNALNGIECELGDASSVPVKAHVALCRVGNAAELQPQAWTSSTDFYDDFRVVNGGNIYELVTPGTTASSGGPTGTSSAIEDGTCVWMYIMTVPSQQWGINSTGAGFRGLSTTRNMDCGNAIGFIREEPFGGDATIFTTDLLETQAIGQGQYPLTRARAVAFQDSSGTPGDFSTNYAAGIGALAAGVARLKYDGGTHVFLTPETVTGGTSGATGLIASFTGNAASGELHLTGVTGVFLDNEALTSPSAGAANANGGSVATCIVTTILAAVGDAVLLTPMAVDPGVPSLAAFVSADRTINVIGAGVAHAALPFFFEVVKKGSFPYDI